MPQKVVQARMWAQALTIGVLIAAGALTHSQRQNTYNNRAVDHSWKEMLAEQQREEEEVKRLRAAAKPLPVAAAA